jgi:hypothetical protein
MVIAYGAISPLNINLDPAGSERSSKNAGASENLPSLHQRLLSF